MVGFSIAELSSMFDRFQKRIYIPLPGPEARRRMFELHVGDTPCEMSPKDYRILADKTDGYVIRKACYLSVYMLNPVTCSYSGSDIAIVVQDALMQPVRKVLTATHFKYLEDVKKWTPCSPGDPDAQEKSWTDIESDELQEPALRVADFLKSVDNVRPTVTAEDLKKHDQWTLESGEPGNVAVIAAPVPEAQTDASHRERGIMNMKNAILSSHIVPLRTYRSFD